MKEMDDYDFKDDLGDKEEEETPEEKEETERLRKKYKYIVGWGKMMGSYDPYINDQIRKAEGENASEDSIYHNSEKGWIQYDDLSQNAKERLGGWI